MAGLRGLVGFCDCHSAMIVIGQLANGKVDAQGIRQCLCSRHGVGVRRPVQPCAERREPQCQGSTNTRPSIRPQLVLSNMHKLNAGRVTEALQRGIAA
jgi:hypothetical protein